MQAARQRFALIRSSLAALSLEDAKAQMALSQRLLDGIEHSIQESLDGPMDQTRIMIFRIV